MEFQDGEEVLVTVSPAKVIVGFNIKGKLRPPYIGSFKIVAQVEAILSN